jgi:C4-dicarboxylate-specific signal transduction histidine kinase
LRRADGSYGWIADTGIPRFTPDGEFEGYIGYCWDITEHKLFEEMRAKMEHAGRLNVVAEMASGLAHELSQPLSACNNYLDGCLRRMNEDDWDKEKLHMAIQQAYKQSDRAGRIINHLKDMVRKQSSERSLIDLNSLAREVMTLLENDIKRQGISIKMILFPLPRVMACRVEIEQVLLNLYMNAIEAMHACPQRELRVTTSLAAESDRVVVAVSDSGRGISPSEMAGLFTPYQTSKQQGLGLGLAICRTAIENHGGRIWADKQRAFGAEFYFTLPVGDAHQ